jgi:hypothetical protein
MSWMLDLDYDIESDLHRFHGLEVDLDEDQYAGLSAERLFGLIERLGAYDGALAGRIHQLVEEQRAQHPSAQALQKPGTTQIDATTADVAEQLGDWVEISKV